MTRDEIVREVLDAAAAFMSQADANKFITDTYAFTSVETPLWERLSGAVETYLNSEEE